jgi:acetyl-CoA acetyltransferase
MNSLRDRGIAIIGYAHTRLERRSGKTVVELAGEVLESLVARSGVERSRIDGFATTMAWSEAGNPFWSGSLAESLGLSLGWCQALDLGGASPVATVARAAAAIMTGQCEMVFCLGVDAVSTQDHGRQTWYRTEFLEPAGYSGPLVEFALLGNAYAARYGYPQDALARLAVAQRAGAVLNENACDVLRKPLAEADYLASRVVAEPLRVLDCVMRCDGAMGVLVTSTRLAKALGCTKLVHPIAYGERVNFDARQDVEDITLSGLTDIAPRLFANAALQPADIRSFHPYDDFTIIVLLQLEHLGFCAPGASRRFVLERNLRYDGDFPVNPGGGQLSTGQPGLAGGGVNLVEAVQQLFGEAGARQVRDTTNALVTGTGGVQYARNWANSSALILERSA